MLPVYKQSYDLVDNALTPLEEAALAHVLCSPDTSYGDVAGQVIPLIFTAICMLFGHLVGWYLSQHGLSRNVTFTFYSAL